MTPVVQHFDRITGEQTFCASIRDDLAEEVICCVACKGTGDSWVRTGGDLLSLGWTIHQNFGCRACGRRGWWRNR